MKFYRGKYEIKMTSYAMYRKWKKATGFRITHTQWVAGWTAIREQICESVLKNPAGVDLPFFMGNVSIKLLDNEFNGPEDMLYSSYKPSAEEPFQRQKIFTGETPKRAKVVWQKHTLFMGLAAVFGMEITEGFKKSLKKNNWMRKNIHHYHKARKYKAKKSKHVPTPKKSLFD